MSEIQKQLATLEQKDVKFQGDKIPAVKASDGLVYAPIAPICTYLGLDVRSQRRRINSDDILSEVRRIVAVETASGNQSMVCLPIEFGEFCISPARLESGGCAKRPLERNHLFLCPKIPKRI